MKPTVRWLPAIIFGACVGAATSAAAHAQSLWTQQTGNDPAPVQSAGVRPELLRDVAFDQKLNTAIPLDLKFRDEKGKAVELGEFFGRKPVILTLVYYQCPMLCTQVLNSLTHSLKEVPLELGKDFEVVTVSIDPTERPVLAEAKRQLYVGMYARAGVEEGWHFLTGDEPQIKALAAAVGFHYAYDKTSGQFAHPSGIMVLTPDGRLARYFYGIEYPPRDVRFGLEEASAGKIGSPVDQILLYCYHYDPATGKYGLLISRVLQGAGLITMLGIAALLMVLIKREHRHLPGHEAGA
ncbi:MAG TPA: SCO family protein [Candidatus Acidoferrales bacterium]|nr:SCO family protein [Candidatus Acidoferrales bacterium]